jgi:hypothetical protein
MTSISVLGCRTRRAFRDVGALKPLGEGSWLTTDAGDRRGVQATEE